MQKLPRNFIKRQSGQALLLVLLVMSVVLTLSLSSVSRSVTDVEISTYEDSSIRAFDAAQSGIEKSVVGQVTPGVTQAMGNEATFSTAVTTSGKANFYKYPLNLVSGESAIISMVDHRINTNGDYEMMCDDTDTTACVIPQHMRICWGMPGTPESSDTTPAIFIEYYYNSDPTSPQKWEEMADLSSIKIATVSADYNSSRRSSNKFHPPDEETGIPCQPTPNSYEFTTKISVKDNNLLFPGFPGGFGNAYKGALLLLKITMLYNDTPQPLAVVSAAQLPSQGSVVASTGQSGDVYRKLTLFQGFPEIPIEFTNSIFSRSSLVK